MDSLRPRAHRHFDDGGNMQITLRSLRWAYVVGFVGHTHMQSIAISIAIHGHAAKPQFAASANDTHRYFTTIGYQHLLKRPVGYRVCLHRGSSYTFGYEGDREGPHCSAQPPPPLQ